MQIQRGQRRARVKKDIQQANTESKSTMQSERILYGVKENNADCEIGFEMGENLS